MQLSVRPSKENLVFYLIMIVEKAKIARYERLLSDILSLNSKEEARILLHVILRGGFTTKDTFYSEISISRPTLIKKIALLIEKGYLRQNEEFNPIRITLLANFENLLQKIKVLERKTIFARDFVIRMNDIRASELLTEKFKSALGVLLGNNIHKKGLLVEVLSLLYIRRDSGYISIVELRNEINSLLGEMRTDILMCILNCNSDLFYVFSQKVEVQVDKQQKLQKKHFVTTKYNLVKLAKALYVKRKYELKNYKEELEELFSTVEPLNYDLFPHQLLPYVSSVKQRVNSCLKFYSRLDVFYNGIYDYDFDNFLKLITMNNNFSKYHKIRALSTQKLDEKHLQVVNRMFDRSVSKDYKQRDIILFKNENEQPYGALIFPKKPLTPYYLITPHILNKICSEFKYQWG